MKNVIICLMVLSTFPLTAQRKKKSNANVYQPKVVEKCAYNADSLNHGPYEYYFENRIRMKGFYTNGRKDSTWLFYANNNTLILEANYKNGVLQGKYTLYKNSNPYVTGMYKMGERESKWVYYPEGGKPKVTTINDELRSFEKKSDLFTIVEEMPILEIDGHNCLEISDVKERNDCGSLNVQRYIAMIRYPQYAKENTIEGTVYVKFIRTQTGMVENISIHKGAHEVLNIAAMEHIAKMPNFYPGLTNGRPVFVQYMVPIRFKLN